MRRRRLILAGLMALAFLIGVLTGSYLLPRRGKQSPPSFEELAGRGPAAEDYARADAIFEERLWRLVQLEAMGRQTDALEAIEGGLEDIKSRQN